MNALKYLCPWNFKFWYNAAFGYLASDQSSVNTIRLRELKFFSTILCWLHWCSYKQFSNITMQKGVNPLVVGKMLMELVKTLCFKILYMFLKVLYTEGIMFLCINMYSWKWNSCPKYIYRVFLKTIWLRKLKFGSLILWTV